MKALTFNEFWSECYLDLVKKIQDADDTFYPYFEFSMKLSEYEKFISKTFNPKMITELFEGFKQGVDTREHLIGNFTIFVNDDDSSYPYTITENEVYQASYFQPQTLNDFINDCQRAGIELEWSESALKQYEFLNN